MKKTVGWLLVLITGGFGAFFFLGTFAFIWYRQETGIIIFSFVLAAIPLALSYFFYNKMVKPDRVLKKKLDKELVQEKVRQLEKRKETEKFITSGDNYDNNKIELINVIPAENKFTVYNIQNKSNQTFNFNDLLGYEVKVNDKSVQYKSLAAGLMTPAFSNAGLESRKKVDRVIVYLKLSDFDTPVLPVIIYDGPFLNTDSNGYQEIDKKLRKFTTYLDIIKNKQTSTTNE
ncbi:hypothetical protein P7D43_18770 [Enterococcus avium]|uniref:Uncharacterized protein n=1 Tax=Enterococcus avium TaxID=33945 RepID=A0AAW8RWR7_ENTAV|nr:MULTISPECIES: hypothetical protein [Enterococcus]MDT2404413.1 hypothetical protein [Enterococcus avium]MDT2434281.1 hypothetical protein [Enterococcus avium]MDT2485576.1 hypothetical protein [Enterococcus avium]MDT2512180.1 hypothetical protein [Enterococcus avium]MDT2516868.1 hypothetical protein [Enterococcus avium]